MSAEPAICADCGFIGPPRKRVKGSKWVEKFLWWVFFIPGPFYSLWRKTNRKVICAQCGGENLTPFDSAEGQKIFEKNLEKHNTNRRAR